MCSTAIPPKADDAFRALKYVPYTALTHAARMKAAHGEEEFVLNAQGGLTARGLDRRNERTIGPIDWQGAAHAAEERTRTHHGDERAAALIAHHRIVLDLARLHDWEIALEYDIQQREMAALHPEHDLSTIDLAALTIIATRTGRTGSTSGLKRSFRSPSPQRAGRKMPRLARRCFRCGREGHLPGECGESITTAGKAVAPLVKDARTKHALATPGGRRYCFEWARSAYCARGSKCLNAHGCSLCREASHGAGTCPN